MAAPALSRGLSLLVLLLPLAVPQASAAVNESPTASPGGCRSGGQSPEGHAHPAAGHAHLASPAAASKLTCFYNSRANISCVWSWDGGPRVTPCHIHAQPDKRPWNESCELLPVRPGSWACNLILGLPDSQKLTIVDVVSLSVMCREGERWARVLTQQFKPFESVRLMPPSSLQVAHIGTHRCNVTWNLSQFSHYLQSYVEFEVRTRSPGLGWEEAQPMTLRQNQQWISLETLTPDTPYELQVRVRPQLGSHKAWSPWSRPLAFRTRPAAPGKKMPPIPWSGHIILGLGSAFSFVSLVYFLAKCQYIGPWLKTVLKCHIPDPSEFFSQLSSEHGGDFQKWLSSPFPSSSFSPSGPAPEISPLEVLDRDAKATQLLLLQQDKGQSPSPETSGHSVTSCFTNQGYFFFHLPDALEIEACQVYFAYDPCVEEMDEGGPGAPEGALLPPLLPLSGEDDAYCTFPPGDELLLFSPSLLGGPAPPNAALGGAGAGEAKLSPSRREGGPGDWAPGALGPPTPGASDLVDLQSPPPPEHVLGEAGEDGAAPSPREGADVPWASPPGHGHGHGHIRAPTSCLTLNTDAYLSLQELQDQDPVRSV